MSTLHYLQRDKDLWSSTKLEPPSIFIDSLSPPKPSPNSRSIANKYPAEREGRRKRTKKRGCLERVTKSRVSIFTGLGSALKNQYLHKIVNIFTDGFKRKEDVNKLTCRERPMPSPLHCNFFAAQTPLFP